MCSTVALGCGIERTVGTTAEGGYATPLKGGLLVEATKTNGIDERFHALCAHGRKAFIPFIMAGDPTLEATLEIVLEMEKRGADIIELGVPFSDPIADGPINQAAAVRALRNETSLRDVFALVRQIRDKSDIPLVLFSYYNPILQFGLEEFARECMASGVDGSLAVDLPPEEASQYKSLLDAQGIKTIFLLAPTSTEERLNLVANHTTGFSYFVSVIGITGIRDQISADLPDLVNTVKRHTNLPVAVGFGISTPEQAKKAAATADGIVVGSAIVRKIGEHGSDPNLANIVGDFVESLVKAIRPS